MKSENLSYKKYNRMKMFFTKGVINKSCIYISLITQEEVKLIINYILIFNKLVIWCVYLTNMYVKTYF